MKISINTTSSIRIPKKESYWLNKGKVGKKVMLYFHDDTDGIFSAVAMKKYLLSKGFEIIGYGVVNYQESWNLIELNPHYINVAVDFAEFNELIDIYIDHHGKFGEHDEVYGRNAIKTSTDSAYEGIMTQLGLPVDKMIVDVISMIDSAKYSEMGIDWKDLLTWDFEMFKKHEHPKLIFAGVFNQLLKRGDYRTFVEVVHNATDTSIYQIYRLFKFLYPMNNMETKTLNYYRSFDEDINEQTLWDDEKNKSLFKDFIVDGTERLYTMIQKTSGDSELKKVYHTQKDFVDKFVSRKKIPTWSRSVYAGMEANVVNMDGYVVIGELVFVPSGTWANSIRSRSLVERDIESGRLPNVKKEDIKWILLQYGDTLQICSFDNMYKYDVNSLPTTKDGKVINNLKNYVIELLERFENVLNFDNTLTLAGGHTGIGTISNIGVRRFLYDDTKEPSFKRFNNLRYLDLFKNYMIANLSKVKWDITMSWENPFKDDYADTQTPLNARIMLINQIRQMNITQSNEISYPKNYIHKKNMNDLKKELTKQKELV